MKPQQSQRWSRDVKIERLPARVTRGTLKYVFVTSLFLSVVLEIPGELEATGKSKSFPIAKVVFLAGHRCYRYTDFDVGLNL